MTVTLANCLECGKPFNPVRRAMKTCSKACKQKAFRAEKCNTGYVDTSEASIAAVAPHGDRFVRVWGPNKLSAIELRVLGIEPTGLRSGNAMLYRKVTP